MLLNSTPLQHFSFQTFGLISVRQINMLNSSAVQCLQCLKRLAVPSKNSARSVRPRWHQFISYTQSSYFHSWISSTGNNFILKKIMLLYQQPSKYWIKQKVQAAVSVLELHFKILWKVFLRPIKIIHTANYKNFYGPTKVFIRPIISISTANLKYFYGKL